MLDILLKVVWSNEDIMMYFGCGKTKASEISHMAKVKYKGIVPIDKKKVYRDSVFMVYGLDVEKELRRLRHENY